MSLKEYKAKRHFDQTPEPSGAKQAAPKRPHLVKPAVERRFCVQQHRASHLHYDFRLEMEGVLKSWAVPKGPTLDPEVKRLAMQVEDHPVDYLTFEGIIPDGNYGAGEVIVWDLGTYETLGETPPVQQLERGSLKFRLKGKKLHGEFALAHMHSRDPNSRGNEWLLFKKADNAAVLGDTAERHPASVISGHTLKQMATPQLRAVAPTWGSNRDASGAMKEPAPRSKTRSTKSAKAVKTAAHSRKPPLSDQRQPEPLPRPRLRAVAGTSAPGQLAPDGVTAAAPRPSRPAPHQNARTELNPSAAARARHARAPLPAITQPMLATLIDEPFSSPEWLFEIKWDGIRALAYIENGSLRFSSRRGLDLTAQYPELHALPDAVHATNAILDGEIVVLDEAGHSSFSKLQQRMNLSGPKDVERARKLYPVLYYAFDLLFLDGEDLRGRPLLQRKERLRSILTTGAALRYSDHIQEDGRGLFQVARAQGLEGIVAKRENSRYEEKRSRNWLKIKISQSQEVAILGYTDPQGSRTQFGSLLLGVFEPDSKRFVYAGKVGTGFDTRTRKNILPQLTHLPQRPDDVVGTAPRNGVHWVKPELVAEVKFLEWTNDNKLRAPVFLGLRIDKNPRECIRELPATK